MLILIETKGKLVELSFLILYARPINWTNTLVNGIRDTANGNNIPCRKEDLWCPMIEIDTGKIVNWKQGTTAYVHYRLPDGVGYDIMDENVDLVVEHHSASVPKTLHCTKNDWYGDTIIMDIDEDGVIKDWKFNVSDFAD